jgi:hypothetical protein
MTATAVEHRRQPTESDRPASGVWWLAPAGAIALVVPITLLIATAATDAQFRSHWGTPKSLTSGTAQLFLAGALLFTIGALVPLVRAGATRPRNWSWPRFDDSQWSVLERAAAPLFWLTIAGYVAFWLSGLRNGVSLSDIRSVLVDQDNLSGDLKRTFTSIPGVTTATQLGIAFVVVALVLLTRRPDPKLRRRLWCVLGLGLLRAFFVTERLAILELLIPAVAIVVIRGLGAARPRSRRLVRWAPLAIVPVTIGSFALFEYSRSWVYFVGSTQQPYAEFAVDRLAGYYATAYNNGELTLLHDDAPGRLPHHSLAALWTAPVVEQLGLYEALSGQDHSEVYTTMLEQHGNPEFNSPSGLAIPFVDYGTVGGFVFLLAAGLLVGWLYRRFCDGTPDGVLLYPVLLTGIFEIPRYLYWTQGRVMPSLLALAFLAWRMHSARRPQPASLVLAA